MKKILLSLAISFMLMISMNSCTNCNKSDNDVAVDTIEVVSQQNPVLTVENIVSTDRQYMYMNYGGDYRWFETCIVLKDFLDEENDGTITGVSNVFQVVEECATGADVHVILASHTPDTTAYDVKHAFWVEDYPLNEEAIAVTFKEAYDKVMQTNCPKPHSRHCVLRKEVGPVDANPQYIFGNSEAQVYVDAVDGTVSTDNPAFPEAKGFGKPLGEWP